MGRRYSDGEGSGGENGWEDCRAGSLVVGVDGGQWAGAGLGATPGAGEGEEARAVIRQGGGVVPGWGRGL